MINEFLNGLNTDCSTTITLPALATDPWCEPVPGLSQIWGVVIAPCASDDPFEIVTTSPPSLTAGIIDNDAVTNDKARLLLGVGGVAEHETAIYEGSMLRDFIVDRTYTLTFEIPLGEAKTYDFLRNMQRNFLDFRFWYVDLANLLYGTVLVSTNTTAYGGIRPKMVNVQFPKSNARDGRNTATLSIMWSADVEPPRYASPLTPETNCVPTPTP
jgi:hypothetical protein